MVRYHDKQKWHQNDKKRLVDISTKDELISAMQGVSGFEVYSNQVINDISSLKQLHDSSMDLREGKTIPEENSPKRTSSHQKDKKKRAKKGTRAPNFPKRNKLKVKKELDLRELGDFDFKRYRHYRTINSKSIDLETQKNTERRIYLNCQKEYQLKKAKHSKMMKKVIWGKAQNSAKQRSSSRNRSIISTGRASQPSDLDAFIKAFKNAKMNSNGHLSQISRMIIHLSLRIKIGKVQALARGYLTRRKVKFSQKMIEKNNAIFKTFHQRQLQFAENKYNRKITTKIFFVDFNATDSVSYSSVTPFNTNNLPQDTAVSDEDLEEHIIVTTDNSLRRSQFFRSEKQVIYKPTVIKTENPFISLYLKTRCDRNLLRKLKTHINKKQAVVVISSSYRSRQKSELVKICVELGCPLYGGHLGFNYVQWEQGILECSGLPLPPTSPPMIKVQESLAVLAKFFVQNFFLVNFVLKKASGEIVGRLNTKFLGLQQLSMRTKNKSEKELVRKTLVTLGKQLKHRVDLIDKTSDFSYFFTDFCKGRGVFQAVAPFYRHKPVRRVEIGFEVLNCGIGDLENLASKSEKKSHPSGSKDKELIYNSKWIMGSTEALNNLKTDNPENSVFVRISSKTDPTTDQKTRININKYNAMQKFSVKDVHIYTLYENSQAERIQVHKPLKTKLDITLIVNSVARVLANNFSFGYFRMRVSVFEAESFWVEALEQGYGPSELIWSNLIKSRVKFDSNLDCGLRTIEMDFNSTEKDILFLTHSQYNETNREEYTQQLEVLRSVVVSPRFKIPLHIPRFPDITSPNFQKLLKLKNILKIDQNGKPNFILLVHPPRSPQYGLVICFAKTETECFETLEGFLNLFEDFFQGNFLNKKKDVGDIVINSKGDQFFAGRRILSMIRYQLKRRLKDVRKDKLPSSYSTALEG